MKKGEMTRTEIIAELNRIWASSFAPFSGILLADKLVSELKELLDNLNKQKNESKN